MPRYFFNVYDGSSEIDSDGVDLPNFDYAHREAIKLSGSILRNEARKVISCEDWRMEVVDKDGLILFRFDFTTTISPAVASQCK